MKQSSDEQDKRFEECLNITADALAKQIAEQVASTKLPIPPKAHQEMLQKEFYKGLSLTFKRLQRGLILLIQYLMDLAKQTPTPEIQHVLSQITQMTAIATVLTDKMQDFARYISANITLQQIFKLDNSSVLYMYEGAKYMYENQDYDEASCAFALLALLNPSIHELWIGLGNCEYFTNNYEAAILAYAMAAHVNPFDPMCHFYSSKCYEILKEKDLALNALDLAIVAIGNDPDKQDLIKKAQEEKKRIEEKS